MNVLFVSDVSIADVIGGAERVLFEESTRLANRGHDVHVLTRKLPRHVSHHQVIQGVNEWRYDVDHSNSLSYLKSTAINCRKVFESLQSRYSFGCLNIHQPFSAFGVIQSPLGKNAAKIYTCHSLSFEEFQSRNPRPRSVAGNIPYFLNIEARKCIERRALNRSDRIIALSGFTREKLLRVYKIPDDKIVIIPGGVDLERFYPAADRTGIKERLNIPGEKTILLTVRNLVPRMGLENLLHAMQAVIKAVPDVYLVVGGEGPLKDRLVSLTRELGIDNHISFAGFIPEADLPDYYRATDIFILPTLELEGFGLITLEALASGVPVLGTPVGGTVEILSRLGSQYLFKDTGPESMSELIIRTCREFKDNPSFQRDVSSRCRVFVEKNYSWEKNVSALETMIAQMASGEIHEGNTGSALS
ncbi:MAG: glycosyltransferase family 4 protein [Deltaproteobacteria bacterium]|nr:glycosyltransferase family 4 protein [Deltaproteobacteria bacterium]MBN2688422.1 glycosyltransferase family 4 protein [Deltaproteobacteria bacterium]